MRKLTTNASNLKKCGYCEYQSSNKRNVTRHENKCKEKLRQQAPRKGPVTNEQLTDLFSGMHCSITDFNQMLAFFKKQFGDEWFEQNSQKCIQDYCKSMNIYSTTETVMFQDTNKNEISRTLSYISDPKKFFEDLVKARDIQEPKIVLSCDYGKEKLIVTASVYDEKDLFGEVTGGVKPSSPQAALLLAMTDFVPESHFNLSLIFHKLGFPFSFEQNIRYPTIFVH